MTELSRAVALRSQWPKHQHQNTKKHHAHVPEKAPAVVLPALPRSSSLRGPQGIERGSSGNALHMLLAEQLTASDRESYSRSQLRAMAKGRLPSASNNNRTAGALQELPSHSKAARLEVTRLKTVAPLENTGVERNSVLPESLKAAIDHVLTKRTSCEADSRRGDRNLVAISNNKEDENLQSLLSSSSKTRHWDCKGRELSKRTGVPPGWSTHLVLSKSMQGTTLARYRRLVGTVARKGLARSYAAATIRVAKHRFEQHCASVIQRAVLQLLTRRRYEKETRARQHVAVRLQSWWRVQLAVREAETRRQLKLEEVRDARIALLTRLCAARAIQRACRRYRHAVHCYKEECRRQLETEALWNACGQLVRRYRAQRRQRCVEEVPGDSARASVNTPAAMREGFVASETHELQERDQAHETHTPSCEGFELEATLNHVDNPDVGICGGLELGSAQPNEKDSVIDLQLPGADNDEVRIPLAKHFPAEDLPAMRSPDVQSETEAAISLSPIEDHPHSNSCETSREADPETEETTIPMVTTTLDPAPTTSVARSDNDPDAMPSAVRGEEPGQLLAEGGLCGANAGTIDAASRAITHLLQRHLESVRTKKTEAAVLIQRHVRAYRAKHCVESRRLSVLASLREQVQVKWHLLRHGGATLPSEQRHDQDFQDYSNSEGNQVQEEDSTPQADSFTRDLPEAYDLILPILNGKLPPGVSLPVCSAGAPLIPLWKWNWPNERWALIEQ